MNKARRVKLAAILTKLQDIAVEFEAVKDEEQEAFDAMPEGLQNSDRGQAMEEGLGVLEDIGSSLESAIESLEGIE